MRKRCADQDDQEHVDLRLSAGVQRLLGWSPHHCCTLSPRCSSDARRYAVRTGLSARRTISTLVVRRAGTRRSGRIVSSLTIECIAINEAATEIALTCTANDFRFHCSDSRLFSQYARLARRISESFRVPSALLARYGLAQIVRPTATLSVR